MIAKSFNYRFHIEKECQFAV